MTNDNSAEERRLSKFSNADRGAYWQLLPKDETASSEGAGNEVEAPLAEMLEHVIRDGGLHGDRTQPPPPVYSGERHFIAPDPEPPVLPKKLVQELRSAQEQTWAEPPPEYQLEQGMKAALEATNSLSASAAIAVQAPARTANESALQRGPGFASRSARSACRAARRAAGGPTAKTVRRSIRASGSMVAAGTKRVVRASGRIAKRTRPRDWRRRYLALLTVVHRHVFDRRTEQLLFSKTSPLQVYTVVQTGSGVQKTFVYEGPIPRKVLNWALSALPADLKRYAFVDFRSGHGRTLLLAASRNFEYAAGYAFDSQRCDELELNLAQYPRSYLSCRDLRAMRGDRDGIVIPLQPAVLFLAHSLSDSHLDIILSYISASYRLHPRPIYLIFEQSGRERGRDQMEIFERVHLPILNRIKVLFFSPARISVYRSVAGSGADEDS